jgi:hypothetical protein
VGLVQAELDLNSANEKARPAAKAKLDATRAILAREKGESEKPTETYTHLRGANKAAESNLEKDDSRLKPFPTTSTGRRTALANWIASRRNPLTARVLVNHVWARHFGQPLVATLFDFGRKGAAPTHPELLDWLACELMDHGWSMKHMHRVMVTSAAYQMSSCAKSELSASESPSAVLDPENRWLWRQNPVRMEAQTIRDSLLALAGQLNLNLGGPSVPLQEQDASRRRSLYFFQSHNDHNRFLAQFDDANVLECYRRSESIVPQQALALSNSKLVLQATEALAARLEARCGNRGDRDFVVAAFEAILGFHPSEAEANACLEALASWKTELKASRKLDADRKARTDLVAALINHNDFVTIR